LETGFRHFDCSERYRNEQAIGDAMQEVFRVGTIQRKDVFVTTKVWNSNHRLSGSNPLSNRAASALVETWQALERVVEGECKAIGLSNINLGRLQEIVEAARIKPAVVSQRANNVGLESSQGIATAPA
jgi:diketogulonate reductase-like aldo/keto reductase